MRRILTDYGFQGHPLRKSFPLIGYLQVRYDEIKKKIIYVPINLTQNYRLYNISEHGSGVGHSTAMSYQGRGRNSTTLYKKGLHTNKSYISN